MVEQIDEGTPNLRLVPPFALIPKSIYLCYVLTLVITAEKVHFVRMLYLERQQKTERFNTLLPTVYIVTEEQVAGLRRSARLVHKPQEVIILSMNISSYSDRGTQT